jgi:hypothetical protein
VQSEDNEQGHDDPCGAAIKEQVLKAPWGKAPHNYHCPINSLKSGGIAKK